MVEYLNKHWDIPRSKSNRDTAIAHALSTVMINIYVNINSMRSGKIINLDYSNFVSIILKFFSALFQSLYNWHHYMSYAF